METKIKQIQAAVFIRNFNISNDLERASLLTEINQHANIIFNGPPTQLPIPNNAPPEFPRFILNSADGKFSCQIALSRVDIFYKIPDVHTEDFEQLLNTQKNNTENIFNFLVSKGVIVDRIGFIAAAEKILTPGEGNSIDYLRNNFIREGRFGSPKELLFNYNHSGRSENFEMNNLISINAKENASIVLQTDVNTIAEGMSGNNFNLENFNEIVNYAIGETQIFMNNFPNI
ncbi:MAG: hypothetical protein UR99_C0018G0012 [Candidatus Moranbacteria bacterium GW2011_GWD2_36_12]|nr:MAG: hypothetical protein UR99_C0018G0012 [Candidatus Moranbacteria bacterium GW2011_GWD2_36_12]KKQ06222.1 MAG: hypothetical protein US16_C0021G0012 [Candidatus Moranbacteria bacterium GW2011_GWE2_36_40]